MTPLKWFIAIIYSLVLFAGTMILVEEYAKMERLIYRESRPGTWLVK